jgi:hypothetical protein
MLGRLRLVVREAKREVMSRMKIYIVTVAIYVDD